MESNSVLTVEEQIQRARGGLKFNGKDWNGYFYYNGDRNMDIRDQSYSSFGGKQEGDYGVLRADDFTKEFAETLQREGIVKQEAIEKIIQEIRWMTGDEENHWVCDWICDRFRAGPLTDEQEDENIREGLKFYGKDYNGYQYSYGNRKARKPGSTIWGSNIEGGRGIQKLEEFLPEFERAIKRDRVVSEKGIQRALARIRQLTLVNEEGLVTEEVIENFKKN